MKVAVIWNGDEGSACAFGNAKGKFNISFLLTFPQDRSNSKLLSNLKSQCENLGVPFFWAKMKTARPEEYREVIAELKDDYGIEAIVTNGNESIVESACDAAGMRTIKG